MSERHRNVAEGERVSDRLAGETSSHGYPEEGPPGADPGGDDDRPAEDSPPREGAKAPRKHDDMSDDEGDTATGNPRSAG